jgi:hypothetical protein
VSTPLRCSHCFAPYPPTASGRVTCAFCGTTSEASAPSGAATGEGDVILRGDFNRPDPPGWQVWTPTKYQRTWWPGTPAEMRAHFAPGSSSTTHIVLQSGGAFDDVDVSVAIRFLEGTPDATAGLQVRGSGAGSYVTTLNAKGQYWAWYVDGDTMAAKTHSFVTRTTQPALHTGRLALNRLRIVAREDRIRVFHNGVLSMSVRHAALRAGIVKVSVNPSGGPALVGFSDLVVREAQ